ncbi:hypothetical protein GQ43DRAFT_484982 [Delitschia confertaspora ATCC 74209]|uniref:Uncharacterized protein n=1 Tax=Delitschia confertaspora ATCC 74209 TaxID=1513339 RepID=A0A9P4JFP1_9PLEO|nr:hypothetical protein GQ43DRAFT_484982 [Delitschia confertaspora ATCC 74209]
MTSTTPTVLHPLPSISLLDYILTTQTPITPTTLIICSSREEFFQSLLNSLENSRSSSENTHHFLAPTLHNLFTARHVKLAFCASLQALLAYFSAYVGNGEKGERLVLVNPLVLHARTAAFSAQGLSRTFAAAVETAARVHAKLMIAECLDVRGERGLMDSQEDDEADAVMRDGEHGQSSDKGVDENSTQADPWEQEVPILSVSARRFAPGNGERSWAGRKATGGNIVTTDRLSRRAENGRV